MTKEKGKAPVLTPEQFKRTIKFQRSTKYGLRNQVLLMISFYLGFPCEGNEFVDRG
jgi:hypothetical protein